MRFLKNDTGYKPIKTNGSSDNRIFLMQYRSTVMAWQLELELSFEVCFSDWALIEGDGDAKGFVL